MMDDRLSSMSLWLKDLFPGDKIAVNALAGDASFRRYFRAQINDKPFVVMDAPPALENCKPFIAIANAFESASARLPRIISANLNQGFLLLSDFGDQQLLPLLNDDTADTLYRLAIDTLLQLQQCKTIPNYDLPHFDDTLYWREFDILETWYIKKHLNQSLSHMDEKDLKNTYQLILNELATQPTVFVHRDYHSRNIMLCDDNQLGILDFQDAVVGTITYDLVSLLRDCYIAWPLDRVEAWVRYFYDQKQSILSCDFQCFMRWFDFAGLQRHLKCLGIFSRLHYRDHKNGFLKEIPRVLNYVSMVCDKYPELSVLRALLQICERV